MWSQGNILRAMPKKYLLEEYSRKFSAMLLADSLDIAENRGRSRAALTFLCSSQREEQFHVPLVV